MTEFVEHLNHLSLEHEAKETRVNQTIVENLEQVEVWRARQRKIIAELDMLHDGVKDDSERGQDGISVPLIGSDNITLTIQRCIASGSDINTYYEVAKASYYSVIFRAGKHKLDEILTPDTIRGTYNDDRMYLRLEEILGSDRAAKLFVLFGQDNNELTWKHRAPSKVRSVGKIDSTSFVSQRQYTVDSHQTHVEAMLPIVRESVIAHLAALPESISN